jgi:multidrug efflux pump subunit AcrA (membrane-fusion protein)
MTHRLWIVLALAAAGCGSSPPAAPVASQSDVQVVSPQRRTIIRAIDQPGVIEAYERTAIYTKISGYVRKWHVDVGDRVKKDALLVELEVPELVEQLRQKKVLVEAARAIVEQARQQKAVAEKALEVAGKQITEAEAAVARYAAEVELRDLQRKRIAGLVKLNSVAPELLDEANEKLGASKAAQSGATATVLTKRAQEGLSQAKVKEASADIAVAEAKMKVAAADAAQTVALLSYTKLTAPYEGTITDRNVSTGDLVRPGSGDPSEGRAALGQSSTRATPLYLMTRTDRLMFVLAVPELDAAQVALGSPAFVRIQALGASMPVSVSRLSRRLDNQSRTLQAQIDLPNPDGNLIAGMYATGTVKIEHRSVLAVPVSAVIEIGEQSYCYVVIDGKAVRTPVETGISDGTWTELRRKHRQAAAGQELLVAGGDVDQVTGKQPAEPVEKNVDAAAPANFVATEASGLWTDLTGQERIIVGDLSDLTDGSAVHVRDTAKQAELSGLSAGGQKVPPEAK